MGSLALHVDRKQQTGLSPRLQHAVRLLQLSSLDFAHEVRDLLGRNPFLEIEEEHDPDAESSAESADSDSDSERESAAPREATLDSDDGERDAWLSDGQAARRAPDDGSLGAFDTMAAHPTLHSHLQSQLDVLTLPPRDLLLAKVIAESLDDDGYLRFDLQDLAEPGGFDPPPTAEELQIALRRVQALEPAGVGARSVAECLQLQLPAIACERQRALAAQVIERYLGRLAARDVPGLAQALNCPIAEIEAVCDRIRRLDPRPGWRLGATQAEYVTPDVVVRKVRGQWTAMLNPLIAPRVRLNRVYAEMFQRHRAAHGRGANAELSAHLQEARWTLRNIEQRFATILGVAQEIVRRQKRFFDYGPLAMKPLGLKEVANEVGIHESTVSRVTNNKYIATPLGVFELKFFFSRAMSTSSGGECSGTAIRGLIKEMIEAESPERPLSDAELARRLARQGLVVARRTVTKYRQLLRLDAVERRRRRAGAHAAGSEAGARASL